MPKWLGDSYVIAGDGSTITDVKIDAPSTIYAKWSLHAVVKDRLYLFGGQWQYKRRKVKNSDENFLAIFNYFRLPDLSNAAADGKNFR